MGDGIGKDLIQPKAEWNPTVGYTQCPGGHYIWALLCPVINFLLFPALAQTHSLTSFVL